MVRHLFEGFLESDEDYQACQRFWEVLVAGAAASAGVRAEDWPRRTFAGRHPEGTGCALGDPIIDGHGRWERRAFTVIQQPPGGDRVEIAAWLTFADAEHIEPREELVVRLALSEESARVARELLRRWMSPGTSTEDMARWLRGDLTELGCDERRDVRPLGSVLTAKAFIGAVEERKQDGDILVAFVATCSPLLRSTTLGFLPHLGDQLAGILGFELASDALVGEFSPFAFAIFVPEGSTDSSGSFVARLHERAPRDDVEVLPGKRGQVRWAGGVARFRREHDSCLAQCVLAAHRAEVDQARYPPDWWCPVWVPVGGPDDHRLLVSPEVSEAHARLEERTGRGLFD